ncbi:MAG TPA: hypothetical protein VK081_01680 [Planctomycetota bacterium]|nr:hypothetical protein [Planctomycetota bacterium]
MNTRTFRERMRARRRARFRSAAEQEASDRRIGAFVGGACGIVVGLLYGAAGAPIEWSVPIGWVVGMFLGWMFRPKVALVVAGPW